MRWETALLYSLILSALMFLRLSVAGEAAPVTVVASAPQLAGLSWARRELTVPALKPEKPRYAISVLGPHRNSVVTLAWDEFQQWPVPLGLC